VPFESDTGFSIGPHHNASESLNIEPLLPLRLNAGWDLIVQPNFTVTYLPSPHEAYGLEELQTSFFLTPHNADKWLWGIGPIFQFPTATATDLGTGRWSAGPTAALIYSEGPLVQRYPRLPLDVVCGKSRPRKRQSDLSGA
jgi:hypothetical protein